MAGLLDFRTLLVVFALIRILQAIGLVYVWRIHSNYVPARNWAVGSILIAAAALLGAPHGELSASWVLIAAQVLVFSGIFAFNSGIVQACMGNVPWRAGAALMVAALLGQTWFTIGAPSVGARVMILVCVIVASNGYATACALRAPRGPLRGTQLLIAALLILQATAALIGAIGVQIEAPAMLKPTAAQVLFILAATATTFLLALALAVLTNQRTTALLKATLHHMNQGVAMFDEKQRLIICNYRYGQMYGLDAEQLGPGTSLQEIVNQRVAKGIFAGQSAEEYRQERVAPVVQPSTKLQHLSDGRSIAISRQPMEGGGWVTTHEDVTERQRAEAKIAFMAHHDLLTGAANRAFFLEKIEEAVARLRRSGEPFAIFMVDLDKFKDVNDSLGHPAGDALLKEAARRLKASLGETDTLARLGGDEFAIVHGLRAALEDRREAVMAFASRMIETVTETYVIDGHMVSIGTSIGIATAPEHGSSSSELMKKADLALYGAKAKGRNRYCLFDAEMAERLNARQQWQNELRQALSRHELELHYQPIIDVKTGMPCGAEALVRWRHPRKGLLSAGQFISLAEETGLIIPLEEWVLHEACADAAAWPAHIKVAVNLSPAHFNKCDLLDVVSRALVESGLPPERLEVEISEKVLIENEADHLTVLHRLRDIGVSIVLDDFGTGYSSLSYLTKFPFDKIKIDESFVRDLITRVECMAILSSVVALGYGLQAGTIAQGVETREQFQLLRAAGVNLVQGFLFGGPCMVSELDFSRRHDDISSNRRSKGGGRVIDGLKNAVAS
jgi:diguanylate cyclase (GGDEF)-like protein